MTLEVFFNLNKSTKSTPLLLEQTVAQQPIISYYFAPFVYTKMTTHSLRVGNLLLFSSLSWLQAHLDWFVFVTALSSGSPPSLDARFSCYFICPSTGFNIYYTPFSLLRLNKFWSLKHQQLCNSASSPESQLTKTVRSRKASRQPQSQYSYLLATTGNTYVDACRIRWQLSHSHVTLLACSSSQKPSHCPSGVPTVQLYTFQCKVLKPETVSTQSCRKKFPK